MFFDKVMGERTDDVDLQRIFAGILKGRGDQFQSDSFAAQAFGDFGMPDGHPAKVIGFKFQIADLTVLLDFKAAAYHMCRVSQSVLAHPKI